MAFRCISMVFAMSRALIEIIKYNYNRENGILNDFNFLLIYFKLISNSLQSRELIKVQGLVIKLM